ncbi:GNAT family N-acetyltransferase [Curtobacterium sp. MCBA15_004]|uniref:GNAT family N-acetyltransferase n=1 Tax=unclassified Curtobacterium TaxID=257496 RepID=UPI0008DCD4E0|nr:GNAT family N-acetyltransferase [Curtobacterium sp. MCBA15_004]WIA96546.1 GNAT family N-acetyltransferase [Curtobacterium sp. MCBA15_004]
MGNDAAPTVRRAEPRDARSIAEVHVRAWREAYAHLLPAAFLAALDVDAREDRWRGLVADPDLTVLVAERDGRVVGWASAGAGRDDEPVRDRELEGIYVLAGHHGSGTGQALLDAAVGTEPAFLWVADRNPRAEAFYRRNGFERDGATKHVPIGPAGLDAVRMVR